MDIKFDALRTFRVTAECGSLAAAGRALGRTPSAISMTLAQLEAAIGAPLFETDRKNRLTPLGQRVLEESARAGDAVARSLDAIRRHAGSHAGTVRLATVPSAAATVLPGLLAKYHARRPDVRIEISDVDSAEVRRRVMLDEADIGIVSTVEEDITGATILTDALGLVALATGRLAREVRDGAPGWAAIACEPLISNPLCGLVDHDAVRAAIGRSNLEARNTSALLSLVRAGLGVTILPESAVAPADPDLVFLSPADPQVRRRLALIAHPDRRLAPAAASLWDMVEAAKEKARAG